MLVLKERDFKEVDRSGQQARRDRANVISGSLIRAVRAAFRGLSVVAQAFADARRQQALYEELSRMTDRELRDMGINRSDIPAVVAGRVTREVGARAPKAAPVGAGEPVARPAGTDAQTDAQADSGLAA